MSAKGTVGAAFVDFLNAASTGDGSANASIHWFQYNGDTYVVEDRSAAATFAATDIVVKLSGLVELSTATVGDHTLIG